VKSIGARLRAAQLTQLAAVSLDDDPCVGYSLNAEPSNPDSKRFYHFLSLEGAWSLPIAFSYHPGRERVRRSTAWSLEVAACGVRSATRTILRRLYRSQGSCHIRATQSCVEDPFAECSEGQ
jgi:hypothetical protein